MTTDRGGGFVQETYVATGSLTDLLYLDTAPIIERRRRRHVAAADQHTRAMKMARW
jgi:hypothetical protein